MALSRNLYLVVWPKRLAELCENGVRIKTMFSSLQRLRFADKYMCCAVRKFELSELNHNLNKTFIELACSVPTGKILVTVKKKTEKKTEKKN